ncbi:hypothetical protein HNW13_017630 [Shewanella sp. BF02_Schw]|uniref:hypothetical protein n=1 Tax=Shewanella sp. BF02_Schw TaxID=394908 RepID=UPI00177E95CD|nr:hypothetical protein [Shewanella sp. BF02_Schw]MBO1897561.1 hypothetical protein [Shewanella sp. BF02_Schw]
MTDQRNESLSRMEKVINDMSGCIGILSNKIENEKSSDRKLKLQSLAEQGTALSMALLEINNSSMTSFGQVEKNAIVTIVGNAEKWADLVKRLGN